MKHAALVLWSFVVIGVVDLVVVLALRWVGRHVKRLLVRGWLLARS